MTTPDTRELDAQAEDVIIWAMARAGVIVIVPVIGTVWLMANEVYMVIRVGGIYGTNIPASAAKGFIGAMAGAIAGQILASLIPFLNVPVGMALTYAIGKAAQAWIKDGMPEDMLKYREKFEKARKDADKKIARAKKDPRKDKPLGDESVCFD